MLHFAGSELHRMPNEYFVQQRNQTLLEALRYIIDPLNECFLVRQAYGLRGEVEFDAFVYNRVLNYFYEPSFHILTSYMLYVNYLFDLSEARDMNDFMPVLQHAMRPLRGALTGEVPDACLSAAENSNCAQKRRDYQADLSALHDTLDLGTQEEISAGLLALWQRKASQCAAEAERRFLHFYESLY